LEEEIVTLRKYLQKKNIHKNSKVLDDIINSQRTNHDKSIIGNNKIEKGSSSKTIDQEICPRSYVETIRGDKKFYKEDHGDTPPRRFIFQNQR
jgi:hypothetical protein